MKMVNADNKERLAITLDKGTVERIKEIAEQESRNMSNVIQLLIDDGLRERDKYTVDTEWCAKLIGNMITFEECLPGQKYLRDDNGVIYIVEPDEDGNLRISDRQIQTDLMVGRVVDLVGWDGKVKIVVEVDKKDDIGANTGEKELLIISPSQNVQLVGEGKDEILRYGIEAGLNRNAAASGLGKKPGQTVSLEGIANVAGETAMPEKPKGKGKRRAENGGK
jgi:hypothetical protein